jgi:predicted transcriptional regulator
MIRATVYLDERDAAVLRQLAARTGRSQSSIIRDAVVEVTRAHRARSFKSHGAGSGSGEGVGRKAEGVLRSEFGQ